MLFRIVGVLVFAFPAYALEEAICLDHKGKTVLHGDRFFPLGTDPCTQCTCINGNSEMCISVLCHAPENCRIDTLNEKCCQFVCLDGNFPLMPSGGNGTSGTNDDTLSATNLGLRLVASAFTSFLILALLLFMIHRLRQRRLLLVIRRLNGRLDTPGSNGGQQYSVDDETSIGYFVGHDRLEFGLYDEPPPPYSFWKPPNGYLPTEEAPPPYETTERVPNRTQTQIGADAPRGRKEPLCQRDTSTAPGVQRMNSALQSQASTTFPLTDAIENIYSNDTICGAATRESNEAVILSDVKYENAPSYLSDNVTVVHVGGPGSSNSFRLCEDDIANGNVLPSGSLENVPSKRERNVAGGRRNCCGVDDRCHSYNEVLDEWRQRCFESKPPPIHHQRYSVQPVVSSQNNNYFTDPTAWSGEGSESSSSSSPSYDHQTASLSSSDSSSVDGLHASGQSVKSPAVMIDKQMCKPTALVVSISGSGSVTKPEAKSKAKGSSFDRTFQQIKKLSLGHRKKPKNIGSSKQELRPTNLCLSDNRRNRKSCSKSPMDLGSSSASSSRAGSSKNLESQSIEHLQQDGLKLASNNVVVRPSNLNLTTTNQLLSVRQSPPSSLSDNSSETHPRSTSDSSDTGAPLPPTVVAIRCSSSAKVNHLNTRLSDSVALDNSDRLGIRCVVPSNLHSRNGVASRRGLSRSGSVCSETGERRLRVFSEGGNQNHEAVQTALSFEDAQSLPIDGIPEERALQPMVRTTQSCESIHSVDSSLRTKISKNMNDNSFSFIKDDTYC